MNILVTGADGFIGFNVIKKLLEDKSNHILAIDILDKPNRLDLNDKQIQYICSPINKLNEYISLLKEFKVEIAYHFAWKGSAGPLREDYNCQIDNAKDTAFLVELLAKVSCKKLVIAGSIAEFETMDTMYKDNTAPPKAYYYGVGKQLAHELSKPLANSLGIDLIWAYITNAYGIGEKSPRLINNVLRKIIANEDYQFTSGVQNYDFLYIDDIVEAFRLLGINGIKNKGYIIGSGEAKPLREFIKEIYKATNATSKPIFGDIPFKGTNLDIKTFDISNLKNDCGFKPKLSFKEGIKLTYNWIKSN